ncbi:MAG: non-homologous end-joining DNA ligase [Candidatus Methanomethylicus sp.]|nr:non-homologous end-joining DNA ligase [Candidatus Methanomethylicus sp.]
MVDFKELTKVPLSNLDKVIYPKLGITKAKIIEHYVRAAPLILPFLEGRAAVMNRFPDGVGEEGFYEKDAPKGTPSWVKIYKRYSETARREINYVVCDDLDTLIWMANLAAVEINMPLSKVSSYEAPDFILFDIDPEPPFGFSEACQVALMLLDELESFGYRSYVKTSGKKGLHVVIPIVPSSNFEKTREFVHQMGRLLAKKSRMVVSEFSQSRDPSTVFVDFLQNGAGRTMVVPYSLRATPTATVSTPISWTDLRKGIRPEEFHILTVAGRLKELGPGGDPWSGLLEDRQELG